MRSTVTHIERSSEFLREAISANEHRLKQFQIKMRSITRDIKLTETVLKENTITVRFAHDSDYGERIEEEGSSFYSSTFLIWKEDSAGDFRLMFCPHACLLLKGKVLDNYININGEFYWIKNETPFIETTENTRMVYHYSLDLFIKAISRYVGCAFTQFC